MKSVLLHVNNDCAVDARLDFALDFCRTHDAHLTCIQTALFDLIIASQAAGGVFTPAVVFEDVQAHETELRKRLEEKLTRQDVRWDWVVSNQEVREALITASALHDVLIVSQTEQGTRLTGPLPIIHELVLNAGCPVLVVPAGANRFVADAPAIVAWNESPEAAHALRASVPALKLASKVIVVSVEEKERVFPQTGASTYLARHGVSSELQPLSANGHSAAAILTDCIHARGAGLLVMGAYGRSRLREALLGGTTRTMLSSVPAPILLHN